jgi:tetratricopeptide (TPR) repeat protein
VSIARAQEAVAAGDWDTAYELLLDADVAGAVGLGELPLFATVAYASGHFDAAIDAWERAHAEALRQGDELTAAGAATRVAMHLLFDTALMAPVRGWLARAERLLDGREPTPVHAWFAIVRSYERLLSGDADGASPWAQRALELGAQFDAAAAAIGRVATARCAILRGDVRAGVSALEEAAVAIMSRELEPIATGVVYCEVVCALQSIAHYELAEEWTRAMDRWAGAKAIGSLHGRCRVHRAEILRLRGECADAEHEALAACEEMRPYVRRELGWPLTELGRIRFERGDVAGAELAFLDARDRGWDPQPGLALVHFAQGKTALAASELRAALDFPPMVPCKEALPNSELRRVPLLEVDAVIASATGDLERARRAADELETIAARYETKALRASATFARGTVEVAARDAAAARPALETSLRLWTEIGAPYEIARVRLALAAALRIAGELDLAELEQRAAGAARPDLGRAAPTVPTTPAHDVFRREGETWLMTFEGRDVRLRDAKGLRYLAHLLADPGREHHVLELVRRERGETAAAPDDDAGPMLDDRAKEAYRRRLADIEADITDANDRADLGRAETANRERELLIQELARAVGLGGRDRRAGSSAERARVSVTRALRQAIARIREHHDGLADHLDRAVRTGTYCAYAGGRWLVTS